MPGERMTTYNTGNPIGPDGSSDPRDINDNAQIIDKVTNGDQLVVSGRLGKQIVTLAGLKADYDNVVANLAPLGKVYSTLAAANAAIASGEIPNGAIFFVRSTSNVSIADEYQNISGVATATGRNYPSGAAVAELNTLIKRDGAANELVVFSDANNVSAGVIAPDGGLYLCGIFGALQDQWPIKNPRLVETSVSYTSSISPIFGYKTESDSLHEFNDFNSNSALIVRNDGGIWVRGLLGALQDQYAIKNGVEVKKAVIQVPTIIEQLQSLRPIPKERSFFALDVDGNLQSQGIEINRITRVEETGFRLNSWPQGKMKLDSIGRIYVGYNSSNGHGGSSTIPAIKWSDDNGATWSSPVYPVATEGNARGTDWWAMGIDGDDVLWGIIRSRGATNEVGDTEHNIYKSIDRGVSWSKIGPLTLTQNINGIDYVPELYHDMAFINDSMITGYHFSGSSRVGFLKFSVLNPLSTVINVDVIADGDYASTTYVEPTVAVEFDRVSGGTIYGGLRTQTTTNKAKLYWMNPDLTGFTMFDSPDSVQYSPMAIRRSNGKFVLLTIERFNTGVMNLWFCTPYDFYSGSTDGFWRMQIGRIIKDSIVGSSNVGVQAMEAKGDFIYMSWSNETENTYSDTFIGIMTGAAKITSLNTITPGRAPVALGNAFHLDANDAYTNSGVVTLPDFLNSSLTMTPLHGIGFTPTNPVINQINSSQELVIGASSGLAASAYSGLSGVNEVSMYLVAKLNVPGSDSNGVYLSWDAVYSVSSPTNQGFILRRSGTTGEVQFLVDSGTQTASVVATPPTTTKYMVLAFGWSVSNNLAYLNFNGTETTVPMGLVVGPSGGGNFSIGYRPNYSASSGSLSFRLGLGFTSYHSPDSRVAMIEMLKSEYGIN